jgi:spore coat polysaccharide biosynthesis protein SpsF
VATTTDAADDPIVEFCRSQSLDITRGHPVDVLDRYWRTAQAFQAGTIVRVTADCPLIDPGLIDLAVETLQMATPAVDFTATRLPWDRTYPIGLDVEVCTRDALLTAWQEAQEEHQREHVMPFLYEHPERFRILLLHAEHDYGAMRWTVDTAQDLQFIRALVALLPDGLDFSWRDVLGILEQHPELAEMNANVQHKTHRDVG